MEKCESGWYVHLHFQNGQAHYVEEVKLKTVDRNCSHQAVIEVKKLLAEKSEASQFSISRADMLWREAIPMNPHQSFFNLEK